MAEDSFDVDVSEYEGIDILGITSEELFSAAVDAQARWQDFLTKGMGAVPARTSGGKRNPSWVNTGEARSDITVSPQAVGSLEYLTGGDVIQLAIAETGATWTDKMPPWTPIAEWANEIGAVATFYPSPGDAPEEDKAFIQGVRFSLKARGLQGFAPGHRAGKEAGRELLVRLPARLKEAVDQARGDPLPE